MRLPPIVLQRQVFNGASRCHDGASSGSVTRHGEVCINGSWDDGMQFLRASVDRVESIKDLDTIAARSGCGAQMVHS